LVLHLVPLDRYRGPFHGNYGAVAHGGAAGPVGRGELNVAGSDQILSDDHGFGVRGNRHAVVDVHGHLGPGTFRMDGGDAAHLDAGDPHVVARIDRGGSREVCGNRLRTEERIANRHSGADNDKRRQQDSQPDLEPVARDHREPPGMPLYGHGNSARGPAVSGGYPGVP
jgi:hypothetical protein